MQSSLNTPHNSIPHFIQLYVRVLTYLKISQELKWGGANALPSSFPQALRKHLVVMEMRPARASPSAKATDNAEDKSEEEAGFRFGAATHIHMHRLVCARAHTQIHTHPHTLLARTVGNLCE